jgi:hypothetical protein
MTSPGITNFVRQQGFTDMPAASCGSQFGALNFQPRVIGVIVLIGLVLRAGTFFLVLSAVLWWSALVPRLNPFDYVHNLMFAGRRGTPPLTPAPAPRRFSMGMAASFMLGIGIALVRQWSVAAIVLEAFLVVALSALLFGRFCLGSYIFHLIRGRATFANATLPWAKQSTDQTTIS